MAEWYSHNSLLVVFTCIWIAVFGIQYWWLHKNRIAGKPWIAWLIGIALLTYGGIQTKQAGQHEKQRIESLTMDFARLYGTEMEESGHWKLSSNAAANDPLYIALIQKEIAWEKLDPDVSDIYTIRKSPDGKNAFIVDSETDYNRNGKYDEEREQRTPIGEIYDKADEGLEEAFHGKANFYFVPITDRWGTWVSAFVPMYAPSGQFDGVLGVDFDANVFAASIRNAELRVLWMVAVMLLVLLGSSTLNALLRAQIAERRKNEESLRLLGSAVEQSKESIVITDSQLDLPGPRIVFVNPAFTSLTGYTATEVLGKTPRLLQGPNTDKAVRQRLRETLSRGEPFYGETINYRKDKSEFAMEWHIAPIRNSKGDITHYVSIQRDITERKRMEQQMIQSQKLETVGRLAGGVAHEFNNIMMAIIGHADLILQDLPPEGSWARNARVIRKAGERAAALTKQLLAYGRRQFLRPQKLNLNEVIAGMGGMIHHLMGTNVDVKVVLSPDLCSVCADAGQIEEVVTNVILNAQDAMPNGGKLTVETANITFDPESASRYEDIKPGTYAVLAITDSGKGMSTDVKARVFEPFFTTKDIGKGPGLGLATCYGIVKQSGGHISAYSEPGKGTTIRVYLPKMQGDSQSAARDSDAANLPHGSETILMVEDDSTLLEMGTTFLKRLGYQVLTAADGEEALNFLDGPQKQRIDLLFTDVVMPRLDGMKLSERAAAIDPSIKILFTSAYAEQAIIHQSLLDPDMILLQKPFSLSTLAQKVRQALDKRK